MIRILLTVLLPIALPLLLYFAYVKYARPQPAPDGSTAQARRGGPVFWTLIGISVLALAGMIALGLSRGVPPGTKLISPRMEDGRILPSERVDQKP